jgi:hypothetical protein
MAGVPAVAWLAASSAEGDLVSPGFIRALEWGSTALAVGLMLWMLIAVVGKVALLVAALLVLAILALARSIGGQ